MTQQYQSLKSLNELSHPLQKGRETLETLETVRLFPMFDLENIRTRISLPTLAEEAGARFDNPHRLTSHCPLPKHAGDRSSKAFTIFNNGLKWKCHSSCPSD